MAVACSSTRDVATINQDRATQADKNACLSAIVSCPPLHQWHSCNHLISVHDHNTRAVLEDRCRAGHARATGGTQLGAHMRAMQAMWIRNLEHGFRRCRNVPAGWSAKICDKRKASSRRQLLTGLKQEPARFNFQAAACLEFVSAAPPSLPPRLEQQRPQSQPIRRSPRRSMRQPGCCRAPRSRRLPPRSLHCPSRGAACLEGGVSGG